MEAAAELAQTELVELGIAERADLTRYEKVIERGMETFLDVGRALIAIRDGKLYRATHGAFEDYCRERWGISRSYAHRTISAAQVVDNLLPIGNVVPTHESQARALADLEPEQQREIWQEAVKASPNGKPTAAQVKQIKAVRHPKPAREVKPTPAHYTGTGAAPAATPAPVMTTRDDAPISPDEAAAVAAVAAELAEEDKQRQERNAARPVGLRVDAEPLPVMIDADLLESLIGTKEILREVVETVPDPVIRAYVDNVRSPLNRLIDALCGKL